jgi:hypothetical protein
MQLMMDAAGLSARADMPAAKAASRHPDSVCSRARRPPLAISIGWRRYPDRLNRVRFAEAGREIAHRDSKNALAIQFSGMPQRMV